MEKEFQTMEREIEAVAEAKKKGDGVKREGEMNMKKAALRCAALAVLAGVASGCRTLDAAAGAAKIVRPQYAQAIDELRKTVDADRVRLPDGFGQRLEVRYQGRLVNVDDLEVIEGYERRRSMREFLGHAAAIEELDAGTKDLSDRLDQILNNSGVQR